MCDIVFKKFTFAISSPDEFLSPLPSSTPGISLADSFASSSQTYHIVIKTGLVLMLH